MITSNSTKENMFPKFAANLVACGGRAIFSGFEFLKPTYSSFPNLSYFQSRALWRLGSSDEASHEGESAPSMNDTGRITVMTTTRQTRQWILQNKPYVVPVLEGEDATFKLVTRDLPALSDNKVLLRVIYFSNDPAQRCWISPTADPERLYLPPSN